MLIPSVILSNSLPLQHFTAHTSVASAAAVCCPLSSLLLLHSSPAFLVFFLLLFPLSRGSVVWLATQPHQHGHTRGHTTRWQQRHLPTCFSSFPGEGTQAQEVPSEQSKAHAVRHVVEGHSNAADPHTHSLLKNNAHG